MEFRETLLVWIIPHHQNTHTLTDNWLFCKFKAWFPRYNLNVLVTLVGQKQELMGILIGQNGNLQYTTFLFYFANHLRKKASRMRSSICWKVQMVFFSLMNCLLLSGSEFAWFSWCSLKSENRYWVFSLWIIKGYFTHTNLK